MQQGSSQQTMHIGELAERTGLSLRSIRHYDEVGLLPPSSRSDGGFRVYTEPDYERLLLIMQMKPLGFSLEEIAALLPILENEDSVTADARAEVELYLDRAVHKRAKLARYVEQADVLIGNLERITGKSA